jgi:oxalate decarboxylase/phosphoglucose isomerase-like protein (cupin superfamily)
MVDDGEPYKVRAGDTIFIPAGVYHSTVNTGWGPLRLLAIYNPGGPETDLTTLPDHEEVPVGSVPTWHRS